MFEEQKVFEVVVWGKPELRTSVDGVRNLLVDRPDGQGQVRIADVADVRIVPAPEVIQRDASSRYLDVVGTLGGSSHAAMAVEVTEKLRAVQFPFEYRAEVIGDQVAARDATWRVVGVSVIALLLTYLLLQAAVRSWWLALAVLGTVPAALSGGAVAAVLGGRVVSLGTVVGLLTIGALVLRQTLSLVGRFQARGADRTTWPDSAVRRATREVVAPIVCVLLAIAVAVLPIVIAGPAPGLELLHPMAVTVLGGLVTTALVVLFVVPGAYAARDWRVEEHVDLEEPADHARPTQRKAADTELVTTAAKE